MSQLATSRRTLLAAGAALPVSGLIASMFGSFPAAAEETAVDFAALRASWTDTVTGRQEVDDTDPRYAAVLESMQAAAETARGQIVPGDSRTDVFADAPLDTNDGVLLTYRRLRDLATAWATPGSAYYTDPDVLSEIIAGLRTGNEYGYNPSIPEYGNWWTWEVGASTALATVAIFIWDHLTEDDIAANCAALDWYVPDPWYKLQGTKLALGAGRVNMCQVGILRSMLDGDLELLEYSRAGLAVSWEMVTTGDGFYADGSFITHDTVAYSGSYGIETITPLARIFAVVEPALGPSTENAKFYEIIERTFLPVVYRGQVLDSTRGRAISRETLRSQDAGSRVLEDIVTMSAAVDDETRQRWLGLCKSWAADLGPDVDLSSITRVSALRALETSDAVARPEPVGVDLFGSMDRVVIRESTWGMAIAGASDRIAFYEPGNGENPRGFYTGAGMTTLYNDDIDQYDDNFWPTVDWYRLPGTTSDQMRLPDEAGGTFGRALNTGEWTGGSVVHDASGSAVIFAQHVHGLGETRLRARKFWLSFDGIVVALGSAIRSATPDNVETIIENRNLHEHGEHQFLVDGVEPIPGLETSRTIYEAQWAHLEGVGGYLIGEGSSLKMRRETRTGEWADINIAGSTNSISRRYLTLWLSHGRHPEDGTYEYALLPGFTSEETAAAASDRPYTVLANGLDVQAARLDPGVSGYAFWTGSSVGDVSTNGPGTIVLNEQGERMTVSVTAHGSGADLSVLLPAGPWTEVIDDGGAQISRRRRPVRGGSEPDVLHRINVPRSPTPQQVTAIFGIQSST